MNVIPFPKNTGNRNKTNASSTHTEKNSKTKSRYPHPIKRQPPSPEWLIATLTNQIYSDRNRKKNRSDFWF